jgi:hypothetical protein
LPIQKKAGCASRLLHKSFTDRRLRLFKSLLAFVRAIGKRFAGGEDAVFAQTC